MKFSIGGGQEHIPLRIRMDHRGRHQRVAGFKPLPVIFNEQVRSLSFCAGNSTVKPSAVCVNFNLPW